MAVPEGEVLIVESLLLLWAVLMFTDIVLNGLRLSSPELWFSIARSRRGEDVLRAFWKVARART